MATRGQKKANEITTSETVVNMLVNPADPVNTKGREKTQVDPASAKDATNNGSVNVNDSPAAAKDSSEVVGESTNPAQAKDKDTNVEVEASNEVQTQLENTNSQVDKNYLEILGCKEQTNKDIDIGAEEELEQFKLDKQLTLNKAMKAATEGNAEEASFLFRLHSRMVMPTPINKEATNKIMKRSIEILEKDDHTSKVAKAIVEVESQEEDEQPFVENGVTFMPGHVPSTTTSLLTPYFDKNIREFKGPIPLTIFDLGWQALADSYHAEKKVKTDDIKHNNYTGYPYPDDLTLDYGTWCVNYRNFLKTFANPYGWHRFAKWGAIHKENVEAIREASGWMVALRYDVKIRDSAFRMKCSNGLTEGTPDIRKRRKDVEEDCYAEARRFNELGFKAVNPYSKGGERADWNPRSGEPKELKESKHQHMKYTQQKSAMMNSNFINTSGNRGGFGNRGGGRGGRSGYRGPPEHFDPQFAEKKAAAAAAKAKNPTL